MVSVLRLDQVRILTGDLERYKETIIAKEKTIRSLTEALEQAKKGSVALETSEEDSSQGLRSVVPTLIISASY